MRSGRKEAPSSVAAYAATPSPPGLWGGWKPPLRDVFGLCVGAHIVRPPVSHRPPLFCQDRRDPLVGYARQFNTPAAAAQTGEPCVVPHPRRTPVPCPRPASLASGGPGESGLRAPGGTHVEPWSRRERHPAALCRRGQSKPPRRAESLGGGDGGMEGRPLIRHGMRRDTFPPGGGKALGAPPGTAPVLKTQPCPASTEL